MKLAIATFIAAVGAQNGAFALAGFITGNTYSQNGTTLAVQEVQRCGAGPNAFVSTEELFLNLEMSCQVKKGLQGGLAATSLVLSLCSAASTPIPQAKAIFTISGIVAATATFVLNWVPCTSDETQKFIQTYCALQRQQGFSCDPLTLKIERK